MKYVVRRYLHHEGEDYKPGDPIEFAKDSEIATVLEANGSIVSEETLKKAETEAAEAEKVTAKRAKADAPAS